MLLSYLFIHGFLGTVFTCTQNSFKCSYQLLKLVVHFKLIELSPYQLNPVYSSERLVLNNLLSPISLQIIGSYNFFEPSSYKNLLKHGSGKICKNSARVYKINFLIKCLKYIFPWLKILIILDYKHEFHMKKIISFSEFPIWVLLENY